MNKVYILQGESGTSREEYEKWFVGISKEKSRAEKLNY